MSSDFVHVLLTRFSVRFANDQSAASAEWLLFRWAFFRDALASSLANQTVREFRWLVFFDDSAPDWLRDEVAELAPGLFTPVWLTTPWGLESLRVTVGKHLGAHTHLITTRVDSDDAVARLFVEEIQASFAAQDSVYVNFLSGAQVTRSGQVLRYRAPSNAFISYTERIEPDAQPHTVFRSPRHGQSQELAPVLNIVGEPR